jgi:ubiquitin-protein ligase
MFSRAHLLIEHDLNELIRANSHEKGIVAFPLNKDNLFDIIAKIEGPPKTIWESGVFQIYLKFNEYYKDLPPVVCFQTIPFHPNIDVASGKPSVDFLDDLSRWKSDYSIKYILEYLQQLLAQPLLDRAVNMDAVFMLKGHPQKYAKIAHESVIASQRIQKGHLPFESSSVKNIFIKRQSSANSNHSLNAAQPQTPLYSTRTISLSGTLPITLNDQTKTSFLSEHDAPSSMSNISTKRVSFEDYHRVWMGIATSKSKENSQNFYLQYDLKENPAQMAQHLGLSLKDLETQMMQQLSDHKNIMYGKFEFKKPNRGNSVELEDMRNVQRLNKMRNVYLKRSDSDSKKDDNKEEGTFYENKTNNSLNWENEVDDLVNWTKNLE